LAYNPEGIDKGTPVILSGISEVRMGESILINYEFIVRLRNFFSEE
jgi:hypothetical protein